MIFVTGGAAQGTLAWTLAHTGMDLCPVMDARLADREYVLCREVGCGLVPMDPGDRAWREAVGRLSCRLAQEAQGVVRLWCGLPVWLKGGES